MGLDTVEMIMSCEDAFGISIDDEDAEKCYTAGDLHALIVRGLAERPERPAQNFSQAEVWEILRGILAEQFGVAREEIKRKSRFIEDLGAG